MSPWLLALAPVAAIVIAATRGPDMERPGLDPKARKKIEAFERTAYRLRALTRKAKRRKDDR
jgi:hypothetical protein